jgi:hypothetical protein
MKCHMFFTFHPIEWDIFVNETIGEKKYTELKQAAMNYKAPLDLGKIAYELNRAKKYV